MRLAPRSTISRVVRDTDGVEFARTDAGSSAMPEAMAKARRVQSEFARNRRAPLSSDRTMDATGKRLDRLESTTTPWERLLLSQTLQNHTAAHADMAAQDEGSGCSAGLADGGVEF